MVYKKDMKVGRLARFLSRFASHSSAGIGVDSPYKMQFAINERGALFVLWAAFCAGVAKLFGKRGVFYEMVGQEVSGLDGFYDHEFQEYGEFGIRIPENPGKVCDEIEAATGVQAMIVDANDLNVEILGKASSVTLDDETLKGLIRDNPAGQSRELTPFILIREVKEERARGGAGINPFTDSTRGGIRPGSAPGTGRLHLLRPRPDGGSGRGSRPWPARTPPRG